MNKKIKRFCNEYIIDLNATQAAIRAGYSEKTAYSQGHRLLKNVEVQDRIKSMQTDLQKASGITALKVLKEHQKIAFSSIAHLHNSWIKMKDFEALTDDDKAAIKSISTKVVKRNIGTSAEPDMVNIEYIKVEFWDKQKALDSIANLLGLNQQIQLNNQSINIVWNKKRNYGTNDKTE